MAKVICTHPAAASIINVAGEKVRFYQHKLGMISEEISQEMADLFAESHLFHHHKEADDGQAAKDAALAAAALTGVGAQPPAALTPGAPPVAGTMPNVTLPAPGTQPPVASSIVDPPKVLTDPTPPAKAPEVAPVPEAAKVAATPAVKAPSF